MASQEHNQTYDQEHTPEHITIESELSQEIMMNQPIINVGTIGHVANGKSTLVKCLSEKETQQYSEEKEKGITVRLGYANSKIWKCQSCPPPQAFGCSDSATFSKNCTVCGGTMTLVSHISIVDCPGHSDLTSTMLNGSSVMDYAILVEACNANNIPAPQTVEHLMATKMVDIPTSMVVMNKLDLIDRKTADQVVKKIDDYLQKMEIRSPIVPISARFGLNIDVICEYMARMKVPKCRDRNSLFKMIVIRSFDINKPGVDCRQLNGGVIGGTITRGTLNVGDQINIYPGLCIKKTDAEQKSKFKCEPISGKVISIKSEKNCLKYAVAGGLLGIQLTIDPAFSRNDLLAGSLVFKKEDIDMNEQNGIKLVETYDKIIVKMISFFSDEAKTVDQINEKIGNKIPIMINISSNNVDCTVMKYSKSKKELYLCLSKPIAVDVSRSTENFVTILNNLPRKEIWGRGRIVD
jgi:translation initiation factor 2 subunit 3